MTFPERPDRSDRSERGERAERPLIAVFGATGVVGRRLCEALAGPGARLRSSHR